MGDREMVTVENGLVIDCQRIRELEAEVEETEEALRLSIEETKAAERILAASPDKAWDRIRELEAEVARWKRILAAKPEQLTTSVAVSEMANAAINEHSRNADRWKARAEAAESKLRAVGELPGKWRKCKTWPVDCADELEALLKKEQSDE